MQSRHLVTLCRALAGSNTAIAAGTGTSSDEREEVLRLPDGTPHDRYLARVLSMLSIEWTTGKSSFLEMYRSALFAVLPPAASLLDLGSDGDGEVGGERRCNGDENEDARSAALSFVHSLSDSKVNRALKVCLAIIADSSDKGAPSSSPLPLLSLPQTLDTRLSAMLEELRSRNGASAGMSGGYISTQDAATIDELASFTPHDLSQWALGECLVHLQSSALYDIQSNTPASSLLLHALESVRS